MNIFCNRSPFNIFRKFSLVAHINLSHFWDALTGMFTEMRLFLCSRSPFRRVKFCSRSQFISKGLVSKWVKISGLWNIFDFNFGFNFLESHTPAQLLWLRTWSGQKYFRSRSPFGSLRVRSFHTPFRCLFTAFIFFFFPKGCPMGPVGPHWLYKPLGLVHRTPKGSGIKIPSGFL